MAEVARFDHCLFLTRAQPAISSGFAIQCPREESNLCARGRNPLLFQLSYGGKRERLALPVEVVAHDAVESGRCYDSTS